jgi:hypothetical protein
MATAVEMMRREKLQRTVYARFTRNPDPRVAAIAGDHAWLLACHAVDAVLAAECTLPEAKRPADGG